MLTQLGLSLRIMVSTQDFGSCGGSSILPGTTKLLIYEERRFIPLACITFSSTMVGCLIINGDVPKEPVRPSVEFIDSKTRYDTIKDKRFSTKNHNNNEETLYRGVHTKS